MDIWNSISRSGLALTGAVPPISNIDYWRPYYFATKYINADSTSASTYPVQGTLIHFQSSIGMAQLLIGTRETDAVYKRYCASNSWNSLTKVV